jgi:ATP-dependent exoDNAse (exonuclease V) alpha subunit
MPPAKDRIQAHSAAWLARQYGFSWDNDGRWTRELSVPSPDAVLCRGDLLLIDEAGMLDQDTARTLLTIADETGARLALVGDRHQLPAVGRGGVLDLAAHLADPDARLTLDNVHRFADPDYAKLSLAMRSGQNPEGVFDLLVQRDQIRRSASGSSPVDRSTTPACSSPTAVSESGPAPVPFSAIHDREFVDFGDAALARLLQRLSRCRWPAPTA